MGNRPWAPQRLGLGGEKGGGASVVVQRSSCNSSVLQLALGGLGGILADLAVVDHAVGPNRRQDTHPVLLDVRLDRVALGNLPARERRGGDCEGMSES